MRVDILADKISRHHLQGFHMIRRMLREILPIKGKRIRKDKGFTGYYRTSCGGQHIKFFKQDIFHTSTHIKTCTKCYY